MHLRLCLEAYEEGHVETQWAPCLSVQWIHLAKCKVDDGIVEKAVIKIKVEE